MKKDRFNLIKEYNIIGSPIDTKEIQNILNKRKTQTTKYEPYSYSEVQKQLLLPLTYTRLFSRYHSLKCKGIWEIITLLNINTPHKYARFSIIIHTSCESETWVTRPHASDSVHIGLLMNLNGKSYYTKNYSTQGRRYRTTNLFKVLSEEIQHLGQEAQKIDPYDFIKKSIEFSEYLENDDSVLDIQRYLYIAKRDYPNHRYKIVTKNGLELKNHNKLYNTFTFNSNIMSYSNSGITLNYDDACFVITFDNILSKEHLGRC